MLRGFAKGIMIICTMCLTFMIFIMLYRMINGKTAYIGLSQIKDYIETINIKSSFNNLIKEVNDLENSFTNVKDKWSKIDSLNDFFKAIKTFFETAIKVSYFPVKLLYELMKFLLDIIKEIYNFLEYILETPSEYIPIKNR